MRLIAIIALLSLSPCAFAQDPDRAALIEAFPDIVKREPMLSETRFEGPIGVTFKDEDFIVRDERGEPVYKKALTIDVEALFARLYQKIRELEAEIAQLRAERGTGR